MKTTLLYLQGMHCPSCKLLVEKSLIELPNIQAVDANVRKGQVWLQYEGKLPLPEIITLIHELGYQVIEKPLSTPRITKQKNNYIIALISLIIFLVLYVILKKTGLFNGTITSTSSPSWGVVLLIGLTAGFSSCMAVVGGLVLAISSQQNQQNAEQSFTKKIIPHFWFNAGRIIGFAIFGGILGSLGHLISLSPFRMSVMIFIVGIVMLRLGIQLSQLSPKLSSFSLTLFSKGPVFSLTKKRNIALSGALTFFLPCGFTFAMQLYAMSTGSLWMGMLVMTLFAIGTLPGLLGVGSLTSIFKGKIAKIAYQVIGILVILLGIYNIANAYGVIKATLGAPHIANETTDSIETLQMTYTKNGLTPATLHLTAGKKYTIVIDVQTTVYGCMSTIYLPGLDSTMQSLEVGKSVTFTVNALKPGTYTFDCAMGVSHGANVIIE